MPCRPRVRREAPPFKGWPPKNIGLKGFEPSTSPTPRERATSLRHSPKRNILSWPPLGCQGLNAYALRLPNGFLVRDFSSLKNPAPRERATSLRHSPKRNILSWPPLGCQGLNAYALRLPNGFLVRDFSSLKNPAPSACPDEASKRRSLKRASLLRYASASQASLRHSQSLGIMMRF